MFSILAYFVTTQPNHLQCVFNCIKKVMMNVKLRIDGYNWIKSDNPSIYYKEHIPLTFLDLCTLDNCLVTEILLQSEK